jgi:hypothetical protein
MGRTRQKLEEAAFFLAKVRDHYFDVLDEDEQARPFLCYLSAFVSAARSVAWIMRSEYKALEGWEAWYQSKQPELEDRALLRRFTAIRNRSEKAEPLRIGIRLHLLLQGEAMPTDGETSTTRHPKLHQYRVTITEAHPPSGEPRSWEASIDTLECALPELGDDDVLRCCTVTLTF